MHTCRAEAQLTIAAPAMAVWETIAKGDGMEIWYPDFIAASTVSEREGELQRVCALRDGGELQERILLKDGKTRTFVYAIDKHPLPPKGVVGTIRVDGDGQQAHVTWDAQFQIDEAMAGEITTLVQGIYEGGLRSLAKHHAGKGVS